jgi:hypothetical protein
MESPEMQVDGIRVIFSKCHCGIAPTEADARKKIAELKFACGYCKEPVLLTHVQMMDHSDGPGGTMWSAAWNTEPTIEMGSYRDLADQRKVVHVRCWEKIFGEKIRTA